MGFQRNFIMGGLPLIITCQKFEILKSFKVTAKAKDDREAMCRKLLRINARDPLFKHKTIWSGL